MPQLKLKRGTSENLNNVSVVDGQLIITTDTKEIYLDNDTSRIKLTTPPPVASVNGKTGAVSLNYSDVGAPSTTGANASGTWGINITGNAATATKLATARTISLTGSVTGSGTFDGSGNLSIATTTNHNHDSSYVKKSGDTMTGNLTTPSVYTSDWFRSTGNSGWYSQTYGGGWYMTDSTYIRSYNSKTTRLDNLCLGADNNNYRLYVNGASCLTGILYLNSPIYQNGGYNCSGGGNYSYYKICTIKITSGYINRPIVFEISGRGRHFSTLEITFQNINNTDPSLISFVTDYDNCYYIKKTTTSTWEVYGAYSEPWGYTAVHRVTGAGSDIGVTMNMVNISALPSGCTQISYLPVYGAVWNDYAECRQSDCEEFGYVLMETGNDSLTKTTERLSHFAGVSSDTWGFSQGETDKAKTPIAVAGRVLVYPYQDRNNYKPGDCVCAAPGGTVDIMTREEEIMYPSRIVGTVSCVPDYEEWGGGEGADRDPVKVNGRIWIKVK